MYSKFLISTDLWYFIGNSKVDSLLPVLSLSVATYALLNTPLPNAASSINMMFNSLQLRAFRNAASSWWVILN
jgi:hypothetical protein